MTAPTKRTVKEEAIYWRNQQFQSVAARAARLLAHRYLEALRLIDNLEALTRQAVEAACGTGRSDLIHWLDTISGQPIERNILKACEKIKKASLEEVPQ